MGRQCPTCGKTFTLSASNCDTFHVLPRVALTALTGKATWVGCGRHIPAVMDSISESDWCTCSPKTVVDGKEYPPKMGEGQKSEAPKVDVGYEA